MGAFDDLIPAKATTQSGGAFDDLTPKQSAADRRLKLEADAKAGQPSIFEKVLAKLPSLSPNVESNLRGFAMGAADPSIGIAQLAANLPGVNSLLTPDQNLSGLVTGQQPQNIVNKAIAQKETEYEQGRAGAGRSGFDASRMVGNIISPVNAMVAARVAPAATTGMRVLQGAGIGAAGGAATPVVDGGDNFFGQKAIQTGAGAVVGGAMTPVLGKLTDAISKRVAAANVNPGQAALETDRVITEALKEVNSTIADIPQPVFQNIRQQVLESMRTGQKLDAASMLRKADFDALNMPALKGQITRDATQFATERNLRGVANVGEPIMNRMEQQNQILQGNMRGYASGAQEAYPAGVQLSGSLKAADDSMRSRVSGLYTAARNDAGKDLDIPLQGLAQDVAAVVNNFGDKVPSGVMNQFRALGLDPANPSNQKTLFTIESADKLLKVINDNVGNDVASNRALDVLRTAVKKAVTDVDATGGPFAPAVAAAAQRFKAHDAIPALEAAANGSTAPDDFVRRFVLQGKTEEVNKLAQLLQKTDPDAYQQARSQIGSELQRAAFGENGAGDKQFAAERFQKALRQFGTNKLAAFFSPQEVETMITMGRVGAYIGSTPSTAPVNYSNPAGAVANLLKHIPGVPAVVSMAGAAKNTINNSRNVNSSLAAKIPSTTVDNVSPEAKNMLARLLSGGAFVGGGMSAGAVRK